MGLFLRCDADGQIGSGHYYRQRSLAQAARERDEEVTMVMHHSTPKALQRELETLGLRARYSPHTRASREERDWLRSQLNDGQDTVVIDGYHFARDYIDPLRTSTRALALFDDDGSQDANVDLLVNVNLGAEEIDYSGSMASRKLLGARYTLLRPQFRTARALIENEHATSDLITNVLITMGGGDVTAFVMTAVKGLTRAGFEGACNILLGATASRREQLDALLEEAPFSSHIHIQIEEVAALMREQDLAICSAGGTSWELCCLGVPMMQVMLFDNQRVVTENLTRHGICDPLGTRETFTEERIARQFRALDASPERRSEMSLAGMSLIDGYGAHRMLDELSAAGR